MKLKFFAESMFNVCPILKNYISDVSKATSHFQSYKSVIPVRGAIILNKKMTKALMVKGWKANSTWGFPRGKINKNEPDDLCAIREVYEEIGFDISPYLNPDDFIEVTIRQKNFKLYIVTGVPGNSKFCPQTRKEISKIEWHEVTSLPAFSSDSTIQDSTRYFMVAPFMEGLSKFIAKKRGLPSKFSSSETSALKSLLGVGSSLQSESKTKEDPAVELFNLLKNSSNNSLASKTQSTESDKNILLNLLHGNASSSNDSNDSNAQEILSLLKTDVDRSQENESLNNFQPPSNGLPPPMGQVGIPPPWQYPISQMDFLPPVPPNVNAQYGVPQFPGAPVIFGVPGYPAPPLFLPQGFPMPPPPPPQLIPPPSEPSTPLQQHTNLSGSIQQSVFDVPRSPTQTPLPNSTLLALLNSRSKGKKIVEHKTRPTHSHTSSNSSSMALLSLLKQPGDASGKQPNLTAVESSQTKSSRYPDSRPQSRNTTANDRNHPEHISSSTSLLNQLRGVPNQPVVSSGSFTNNENTHSANDAILNFIKGGQFQENTPIAVNNSSDSENMSKNRSIQLMNSSATGQTNSSISPYDLQNIERSTPLQNSADSSYDPSADLLNQIKGFSASNTNSNNQPTNVNTSSEAQLLNLLHGKPNTLQSVQGHTSILPSESGVSHTPTTRFEHSTIAASSRLLNQLDGSQPNGFVSGDSTNQSHPNVKANFFATDNDKSELLEILKPTNQPSQNETSSNSLMEILKDKTIASVPEVQQPFEDPAILNASTSFKDSNISTASSNNDNDSSILLGMLKSKLPNAPETCSPVSTRQYKGGLTLQDLESGHGRTESQSPGKDLLQQLEFEESQANSTSDGTRLLNLLKNSPSSTTPSSSYHSSRANSQTRLKFSPVPQENSSPSWSIPAYSNHISSGITPTRTPVEPLKASQSANNSLLSFLKGSPSPNIDSTNSFESGQSQGYSAFHSVGSSSPTSIHGLSGQRATPVNSIGSSLLKNEPISALTQDELAQSQIESSVSEQDHLSSLLGKLQLPTEHTPVHNTAHAVVSSQPAQPLLQSNTTDSSGNLNGKELRSDLLAFLHNFSNGTLPANK